MVARRTCSEKWLEVGRSRSLVCPERGRALGRSGDLGGGKHAPGHGATCSLVCRVGYDERLQHFGPPSIYVAPHHHYWTGGAHEYSAATSQRDPGAAALTYLTNFIASGFLITRESALFAAWIDMTPAESSDER